jgi:multidrug efflux pump
VALSIPLTLFVTFFFMYYSGRRPAQDLAGRAHHRAGPAGGRRHHLGGDDGGEDGEGWERVKAASFAYTSTAMPMLTGHHRDRRRVPARSGSRAPPPASTPSRSSPVTTIALWCRGWSRWCSCPTWLQAAARLPEGGSARRSTHAVYDSPSTALPQLVAWCVERRWIVIGATAAALRSSVFAFRFVQQQFFPAASRPELIVDLRLAEGASVHATEAQVRKLEKILMTGPGARAPHRQLRELRGQRQPALLPARSTSSW